VAEKRAPDDAATMVALGNDLEVMAEPVTIRRRKLGPLVRVTAPGGRVVCTRCEVAESALRRMKGLLGRRGLGPGQGMLINPAPSVMTFFMRFPIDVVFLDRDRMIVGIKHSLVPWRVAGARHAVAALELPAGTAEACALKLGEGLELPPIDG
jgi:uncharacterized membrane protein (UPF0127 family)